MARSDTSTSASSAASPGARGCTAAFHAALGLIGYCFLPDSIEGVWLSACSQWNVIFGFVSQQWTPLVAYLISEALWGLFGLRFTIQTHSIQSLVYQTPVSQLRDISGFVLSRMSHRDGEFMATFNAHWMMIVVSLLSFYSAVLFNYCFPGYECLLLKFAEVLSALLMVAPLAFPCIYQLAINWWPSYFLPPSQSSASDTGANSDQL